MTSNKTIFLTGSAGFIGFHMSKLLLDLGFIVVGLDGMTDYYEVSLKKDRNKILEEYNNYKFYQGMLVDEKLLNEIFKKHDPSIIIHLAAQAGVRYSIENPKKLLKSNLIGTFNILEMSKNSKVDHLLISSTSSVYGSNKIMPFSENQKSDTPMSFYAATKVK